MHSILYLGIKHVLKQGMKIMHALASLALFDIQYLFKE